MIKKIIEKENKEKIREMVDNLKSEGLDISSAIKQVARELSTPENTINSYYYSKEKISDKKEGAEVKFKPLKGTFSENLKRILKEDSFLGKTLIENSYDWWSEKEKHYKKEKKEIELEIKICKDCAETKRLTKKGLGNTPTDVCSYHTILLSFVNGRIEQLHKCKAQKDKDVSKLIDKNYKLTKMCIAKDKELKLGEKKFISLHSADCLVKLKLNKRQENKIIDLLDKERKLGIEISREALIKEMRESVRNTDWSDDAKNSVLELIACFNKECFKKKKMEGEKE